MVSVPEEFDFEFIKEYAKLYDTRLCGFILYTKGHANLAKVLDENLYWGEFNNISGPRWPIFAVSPENLYKSKYEYHQESTQLILDFFGLNKYDKLPCFIVFIWDDDDNLLSTHYHIKKGTIEFIHDQLFDVISELSFIESQILPEYRKDITVYREALKGLKKLKVRNLVVNNMKKFPILSPVIRTIFN